MNKGRRTREKIIRKAAPIFNRKGFEGTALSDLMRATSLEKGGIYRHFASKEQLAVEAFDYSWKTAVEARLEGTQNITNTVDRLKRMVRNFRERRDGLVPGGCPLLNTAIDSDDGNVALREKARQALAAWIERLRGIAEEGQRNGEIRRDIHPGEMSNLVVSTLEGSLMLNRLQRSEEPLAIACGHLEKYLETEIRSKESKCVREKS